MSYVYTQELLKLAENGLTGSALPSLAGLPALKVLGLSRNHIEGLIGIDGSERSLDEALAGADLDGASWMWRGCGCGLSVHRLGVGVG
jgi:hypothetical protein